MSAAMGVLLRRLRAMDADEIRFRTAAALRTAVDRARVAFSAPQWSRDELAHLLVRPSDAVRRRDWPAAHRELARHFASRTSPFPLQPAVLPSLAHSIRETYPSAAGDAVRRADRILEGRCDLLGYKDVFVGTPPNWHSDPLHERTAPLMFWADMPYLDARCGDHKVIWELNRHQQWLALGRAVHLTGDRRYYVEFVAQLESWIAANPPLLGINWASMLELAFRSLSWMWALHCFAGAASSDPATAPPWTVDLLVALDRQMTHVERNLSRYFSPNTHLTGEALALYVAGICLPELRASRRWADVGRAVLLSELDRQVLDDGAHAELSTHYQRYSTDFYLLAFDVARAAGDPAAARFHEGALRQAEFLRRIAADDGCIPLIGDDDGGQLFPICGREPYDCRDTLATAAVLLDAPYLAVDGIPEETMWRCGMRQPAHHIASGRAASVRDASGYLIVRTPRGDHLTLDAGRHGFLNGGHAHADALSVTLSVRGRPLLVDPGTATYTMDARVRDLFRSTAMHNTVLVNGRSQSVPRGPFHWQTTADARAHMRHAAPGATYVEGSHDGYAPVVHVRGVVLMDGVGWIVVDHLLGEGEATAEAFWHLHPGWILEPLDAGAQRLRHASGDVAAIASTARLRPVSDSSLAQYAPVYGRVVPAPCLSARVTRPLPSSIATLVAPEPGARGELALEAIDVTQPPPGGWHGAAFRIRAGGRTGILLAAVEHAALPGSASAPGTLWGCTGMLTDARVALAFPGAGGTVPFVVNGRELALAGECVTVTS